MAGSVEGVNVRRGRVIIENSSLNQELNLKLRYISDKSNLNTCLLQSNRADKRGIPDATPPSTRPPRSFHHSHLCEPSALWTSSPFGC